MRLRFRKALRAAGVCVGLAWCGAAPAQPQPPPQSQPPAQSQSPAQPQPQPQPPAPPQPQPPAQSPWGPRSQPGAGDIGTAPFRTRNLSPPIAIFGIPAWEPAPQRVRFGATLELANHYRLSRRGNEALLLDGETWRQAVWYSRPLGERWTFGFELPLVRQSGGILDDLIDGWHSVFGMPDGGRNARPEGALDYRMAVGAVPFHSLQSSGQALGDAQLRIGRVVGQGFHLQATLKLPTGDEGLLAGSGRADLAVTLLKVRGAQFAARPAGLFWGVGALRLGRPERIEFDARRFGVIGVFGGHLQVWPRTAVKAQLEFHQALYDSRLGELGDPGVQATLGIAHRFGERGAFEFGVNEDLAVSTSPDVVLHFGVAWAME